MAEPLESVPVVRVSVPVPRAAALPTWRMPPFRLSPPVNVLAPERRTVPAVVLVAAMPVPPRIAETVPFWRS